MSAAATSAATAPARRRSGGLAAGCAAGEGAAAGDSPETGDSSAEAASSAALGSASDLDEGAERQVRHQGWFRMEPSAILRSPNWESGRIFWHFRQMRVMSTSLPSASYTEERRRLGRGTASF